MEPTFLLGIWVPLAGVTLALCIGPEPEDYASPGCGGRSQPSSQDLMACAVGPLPGAAPQPPTLAVEALPTRE